MAKHGDHAKPGQAGYRHMAGSKHSQEAHLALLHCMVRSVTMLNQGKAGYRHMAGSKPGACRAGGVHPPGLSAL